MKAISRNRRLLGAAALLALAFFWAWSAGYRLNLTPSLPRGIYRLSPDAPTKGDLVSFCLEGEFAALAGERGYLLAGSCPSGLRPLLKRVAGLPGDTVDLESLALRSADSAGRPMPSVLEGGTIPPGLALVLADHPGSFDSRYFGLVPLNSLQRVEPVFLFNPLNNFKGE